MEELAGKGSVVFLEKYGRGYYGRVLGIIFLPDGTNVNERMVGDGFACVYRYHGGKSPELPMREWIRLNELMRKAKRERRGLWGKAYGEPEATADLVIENWLPGWNMDLSINEAKECLNELVNSGILEKYGIVFERPEKGPDEGLTGGKFHLI